MKKPPPPALPSDLEAWSRLHTLDRGSLRELGLRAWNFANDPEYAGDSRWNGRVLMLFPVNWYESIPEGFEVVNIFGDRKKFQRGVTPSDGAGTGYLSFGVFAR